MDVRLKELIETIKTEGLKNADQSSARIIQDAEKKAEEIIAGAKAEAADIISRAHRESDQRFQSGTEALRQSGRDLILNVEKQLERVFTAVTQRETRQATGSETLEKAIVALMSNWSSERVGNITVLVPAEDLEKIEKTLRAKLADQIRKGLEIKASPGLKSGFRVAERDGVAYYDFSSESIAEALSAYLNPRLQGIIREAAAKE